MSLIVDMRLGNLPLYFNSVLREKGLDPVNVRLLRHQDGSADKGSGPYDLWHHRRDAFEEYQTLQDPGARTRLAKATHWASFVVTPDGRVLFVGVYEAALRGALTTATPKVHGPGFYEAGQMDVYDLVPDPRFEEFAGKLVVDWGAARRTWIQNAGNQDKPIIELQSGIHEPDFPGYMDFSARVADVPALPAAWQAALRQVQGIYLLTCPDTGRSYVGMAAGTEGFWDRWCAYARDGHGGNKGLVDVRGFTVSVLEVAGSLLAISDIQRLEERWKRKLASRRFGFNEN